MKRRVLQRKQTKSDQGKLVSEELEVNIQDLNSIFSPERNKDYITRTLTVSGLDQKSVVVYMASISTSQDIESSIINPLVKNQSPTKKIEDIVSASSITPTDDFLKVVRHISKGDTVLLLDGSQNAYIFATSDFQSRSIGKPENEMSIKGPKESFTEKLGTNLSLIRKKIHSEKLYAESHVVSQRSLNEVLLIYNDDLVSKDTLEEIRNRLKKINVDAVPNISLLEQYIEESNRSLFPTILYTERPDRAAAFLEDGHIVLLMENSPDCLILPATFWSFFHSSEDHFLRLPYGNFTRILRVLAIFITLFSSSIYIAITNYHSGMLPPDLLFAIAAAREKVPLPAVFEILLMEIAFELIREAGLRVPNPIGPTIGIVGALILGQAAVDANIISPIVIIVVALSGLSSFAINDLSLNFLVRMLKFMFIISAGFFGIMGMAFSFTMGLCYMVTIKSFGVSYLAPMSPSYRSSDDTVLRKSLWNERLRPGYLKTADVVKKAKNTGMRKEDTMSMKVMDQIGQKEYFAILLIIIGLKVTDMTPSLIYPDVLSSSWMVPALSYLILLIPISFLCHLLVKLDKGGLYEVNGKVFGKALGNLLNIIFLGILFAAIVIESRSYVDLISTMYFEQSPVIFIYFLFMLVCFYGAKKGLEAIGTVSWLSFLYLEAAILFSLILMIRIGDFNRMFPILGPGVKVIAQESFSNLSLYGEVIVLAFIFPFIHNVKKFKKTTIVGLSVVMVKLFIFLSCIYFYLIIHLLRI
nr:GerAB/ArcD/ProY family transporter [Bacillus coahuilensis]